MTIGSRLSIARLSAVGRDRLADGRRRDLGYLEILQDSLHAITSIVHVRVPVQGDLRRYLWIAPVSLEDFHADFLEMPQLGLAEW